jgi:hypothetical protein
MHHDHRKAVEIDWLAMSAVETARYGSAEDLSSLIVSGVDINQPDEVSPRLPSLSQSSSGVVFH